MASLTTYPPVLKMPAEQNHPIQKIIMVIITIVAWLFVIAMMVLVYEKIKILFH